MPSCAFINVDYEARFRVWCTGIERLSVLAAVCEQHHVDVPGDHLAGLRWPRSTGHDLSIWSLELV